MCEPADCLVGACCVVVGEHHGGQEISSSRDPCHRRTDPTGTDDEEPHRFARSRPENVATSVIRSADMNISDPTTLTCGGMPRCAAPQTYMGNVTVLPELKLVMMKSSKDREKASSDAARMPGNTSGKVIRRKVCHSFA